MAAIRAGTSSSAVRFSVCACVAPQTVPGVDFLSRLLNPETQTSRLLVGQMSQRTAMAATVLRARVKRHCSEVWVPCDFLTKSIPDEWGSSPSFVFSSQSIQGFTRRNDSKGSKNSHFSTKKINIWNISSGKWWRTFCSFGAWRTMEFFWAKDNDSFENERLCWRGHDVF